LAVIKPKPSKVHAAMAFQKGLVNQVGPSQSSERPEELAPRSSYESKNADDAFETLPIICAPCLPALHR